ncbi:MAG: hypothetical protein ACRD4B_02325 [Acidobacteriota bacterium]
MNDTMEYEHDEQSEQGGLWQRIKESPRTVSALIIILIIAAAIYAFSGDNQDQNIGQVDESVPAEQETATPEQTTEEPNESPVMTSEEDTTATPSPVSEEELARQTETFPEERTTDQGYVEVAQAGEGITHLARRATTRYLNENTVEYAVTNEHRIYIEDYLQNRVGSQSLSLGEEQTVSFDLIREAVAAAGQLNENQLRNLSQYTSALS